MNFGFIIDNRKCIGCHACTVACKAEHDIPLGVNRTWVKYIEKGEFPNTRRLFSVMRCNHCADAPCVEICPVSALFYRQDGIVDFDPRRCIGCKACMQACPYDALYIDPAQKTAAKCNYCAHRVEVGLEPACVNVCPEHAIISGDLDDPHSEISQLLAREEVTVRKREKGTRPKLFYIEADEASLTPTLAEPSTDYMWSSQAGGVGHFAPRGSPGQSPQREDGLPPGNWLESEEEDLRILVPYSRDASRMKEKARDVAREAARRVYDAPSKGVVWGWEVSAYVWTKAVATGVFIIPFLGELWGVSLPAPLRTSLLLMALLFLGLTGVLLVKDLDRPGRFLYVVLRPQWRSWLVRGAYLILAYGLLLLLLLWGGGKASRLLQWSALGLAVLVAIYTAFLFAQAKARDFWQSPLLALHMLAHSLVAGSALTHLGALLWDVPPLADLTLRWLGAALVGGLVLTTLEFATPHASDDAGTTARLILRGRYAPPFWLGVVFCGSLLPLAAITVGGPVWTASAALFALLGVYVAEHVWVRAPQLLPLA